MGDSRRVRFERLRRRAKTPAAILRQSFDGHGASRVLTGRRSSIAGYRNRSMPYERCRLLASLRFGLSSRSRQQCNFSIYNGSLIARGGLGARPFFLASRDQFRAPPPPAFGSAPYPLRSRRFVTSDTRTAEQIAIANYWIVNQSPRSAAAMMGIARELIASNSAY